MMVAGEHLMMYHHLTADLMLIQELHGSHNSGIWNYPCNNKYSINIPLLYPTTCLNIKIRNLRMKRTQSFNKIRDVTSNAITVIKGLSFLYFLLQNRKYEISSSQLSTQQISHYLLCKHRVH
jgi:hypothetical protein